MVKGAFVASYYKPWPLVHWLSW